MGISIQTLATLMILGTTCSASAFADAPNTANAPDVSIQPSWMGQTAADGNNSFLMQLKTQQDPTFNEKIFSDPKTMGRLQQQYQDLNRDYEMRAAYGIASFGDRENQINANTDFSHNVLHQVELDQGKIQGDAAQKNTQGNDTLQDAAKPVVVAAALYTGKQVKLKINDDTHFIAASTLRDRSARMGIDSPIVNSKLEVSATAPSQYSQDNVNAGIQDPNAERYRLTVSRPVPVFNLSSAVAYGSTSNTVNASLSKVLVANLSASVNAIRPLGTDMSVNRPAEENVSLSYGLHF
jgi:hypothetical protein